MRTIILAAGEGKRLRPHTEDIPKCLVSINGAPLIHRQLSILENLGYEVILVVGWQSNQLKQLNVRMIKNLNSAPPIWSQRCIVRENI